MITHIFVTRKQRKATPPVSLISLHSVVRPVLALSLNLAPPPPSASRKRSRPSQQTAVVVQQAVVGLVQCRSNMEGVSCRQLVLLYVKQTDEQQAACAFVLQPQFTPVVVSSYSRRADDVCWMREPRKINRRGICTWRPVDRETARRNHQASLRRWELWETEYDRTRIITYEYNLGERVAGFLLTRLVFVYQTSCRFFTQDMKAQDFECLLVVGATNTFSFWLNNALHSLCQKKANKINKYINIVTILVLVASIHTYCVRYECSEKQNKTNTNIAITIYIPAKIKTCQTHERASSVF